MNSLIRLSHFAGARELLESPLSLGHHKYEFLLVIVTLIAAAGWLFTKLALAEFSPYIFLSLRFLTAALVLYALCWREFGQMNRDQFIKSFATGFLIAVSLLVWIHAINGTKSIGTGAFIVSLAVVAIPLINRLLFKEAISKALWVSLIPAVLGLALLSIDSQSDNLVSTVNILFLVSAIGFALHFIFTGRYAQSVAALPLTTIQLVCVGVCAFIAALLTESWTEGVSYQAWIWLLLSAVLATGLRFSLQTKALQYVHSNHAGLIMLLEPVWAVVLGIVLLNESLSWQQSAGCLLILTALLIFRLPLVLNALKGSR